MKCREISQNLVQQAAEFVPESINGATITNEIFLVIQNHKEFMQQYLRAKEKFPKINTQIGFSVGQFYNLEDDGNKRENNPSSTLISSHQKFK